MNDNDFVTGTLPELTRPERTVCITVDEYKDLIRAVTAAEIKTEYEEKIIKLSNELESAEKEAADAWCVAADRRKKIEELEKKLHEKTEVDNE